MSTQANLNAKRSPITSHILDLGIGKAAAGVAVTLEKSSGSAWNEIARARSGVDGRIEDWGATLPAGSDAEPGIYRLSFDTGAYFKSAGRETFYPSVQILFRLEHPEQHHHVPLLLSPFGYSTYRGT